MRALGHRFEFGQCSAHVVQLAVQGFVFGAVGVGGIAVPVHVECCDFPFEVGDATFDARADLLRPADEGADLLGIGCSGPSEVHVQLNGGDPTGVVVVGGAVFGSCLM